MERLLGLIATGQRVEAIRHLTQTEGVSHADAEALVRQLEATTYGSERSDTNARANHRVLIVGLVLAAVLLALTLVW